MTQPQLACELRVLLLAGGPEDPTTGAWASELHRLGVPYDHVSPTPAEPLRAEHLVSPADPSLGRYNAVVLGTDASAFWGALDELPAYRRRFGVRQLDGYAYPRDEVGLTNPAGRPLCGVTARVTPAGRDVFGYLRGPVPIDPGSFGYLAEPLRTADFTSLVETDDGHPLVAVHCRDGLENLVVTLNYADSMLHWRLLARGFLDWATRRTYLGYSRNFFACHVDDVFLANWVRPVPTGTGVPATPGTVRMTGDDVHAVLAWQERHGFTLDLAYNGEGADASGNDELTTALLASRDRFRWVNHTWSHVDLGWPTPPPGVADHHWPGVDEICEQIRRNVDWARDVGLCVSPTALVTGGHSGLANPHLPTALEQSGVTALASDASLELAQRRIGPALTAPRYPTNVYTSVSTWDDQLAEYTSRYGDEAPGAGSPEAFLAVEAEILFQHMLGNDPRPTFAHQSNLTRDRLLLALLERALQLYRTYLVDECELRCPTLDETSDELARRERWHDAVAKGEVTGRCSAGELVVTSDTDIEVPITVPIGTTVGGRNWLRRRPFGEEYAGTCSAWHPMLASERLRLVLKSR